MMKGLIVPLIAVALLASLACGDDDDDNGTPTGAVSPTAGATLTPAASPTSAASPDITINTPAEGSTVRVPFEVTGTASVFEGALTVDVLGNAAGLVLCLRHVQTEQAEGAPWSATIAFAPSDTDSPVTLRAYNFSAQDGSMENVVERSITVEGEHPNIVIESPRCGATVSAASGVLTVSGMAQVFEAALNVDIRDAAGTVLQTRNVMAASGVEYSPWSTTFDASTLPASGFYEIVAYTHSAEDGRVIDEFPIQISLGP